MKKMLVVSWFYPPINSSEGLVTYKLLKASKLEFDVFTQKDCALWSYGNKDVLPQSQNVNIIYSQSDNLNDWKNQAIAYYKENIDKYDIIMTRSMPPESHEIGLSIKKLNPKVKWIASFGDPIANNPYTKIALSYDSPYSRKHCKNIFGVLSPKRILRNILFNIRKKKAISLSENGDIKLQNQIFKNAQCLILNSTYQRDYMLNNQPDEIKDKAIVLNHSFDPDLYPAKKANRTKKIKMVYIGHLDDIRTPKMLFSAISDLYAEDPKLADKIQLEFYGHISDNEKIFIIDNQLTDIIKIKKPVTYLESLKIMSESDWLLQIDANIMQVTDKNIFFAAKLADYIGSSSKILGITMQDGISAEILHNLNMPVLSYSKEEIKNYLWLIIYNKFNADLNSSYRQEFSSQAVAEKFDKAVADLIKN